MRDHTKSLIKLIQDNILNPMQGCEVGVWWGGNAVNLLKEFPTLQLLMVDNYVAILEEDKPVAGMYDKEQGEIDGALLMLLKRTRKYGNRSSLFIGDSIEATTYLKDEFLDFVFIDAHHSYEAVKFDVHMWLPKVKVKGIICGHDYEGKQDHRGSFGVKKAVDEFANSRGYEVKIMPGRVWAIIKE